MTGHPTNLVHAAPKTAYKSVLLVMDLTFIFMNLTFITMFIFPGVLLLSIFMTFIFIFKTIHEVQIHIHVIFMLMYMHSKGNS